MTKTDAKTGAVSSTLLDRRLVPSSAAMNGIVVNGAEPDQNPEV